MSKISVIINSHDGEKYLEKCISSVLNQKFTNFEIIFFDNCSKDNTKKILKKFKDKRIKYFFSKKKLPLYEARNKAIRKCSYNIISFLDVDDWWDKNFLYSRRNIFNNKKIDYFYSKVLVFNQKFKSVSEYRNSVLPQGKIYNYLAKDYFIIISGLLIKKKLFKKIGYFNPKYNIIGDFDFVMRMALNNNAHYSTNSKNFL